MEYIKKMRKSKSLKQFKKIFTKLNKKLEKTGYKKEVMLMFLADKLAQGKFCTDKKELFMIRTAINTAHSDQTLKKIYLLQKATYS
jgi:hypothetical protein